MFTPPMAFAEIRQRDAEDNDNVGEQLTNHIAARKMSKLSDFSYKAYVLMVCITVQDSVPIFSDERYWTNAQ